MEKFYSYLGELDKLVKSAPQGIPDSKLAALRKIGEISQSQDLDRVQRIEIVNLITFDRNLYLNGKQ